MWFSLGIDFIINVIVTSWILISRGKDDGKEVVFNLSGGSHTGTTVLMVIFWVIFVIHLIFCIARSSSENQNYKAEVEGFKKTEVVNEISQEKMQEKIKEIESESSALLKAKISSSKYPFNSVELKFLNGNRTESMRGRLMLGKATDEDIENSKKYRLNKSEFNDLLNGTFPDKKKLSLESRMDDRDFFSCINKRMIPDEKVLFAKDVIDEQMLRSSLLTTIDIYEEQEPVTLEMIEKIPTDKDAMEEMKSNGVDSDKIKKVLQGYAAMRRILKKEYKKKNIERQLNKTQIQKPIREVISNQLNY